MKRYPFIVKSVERWEDVNDFEGLVVGSIGRMEISARYVMNTSQLAFYPPGTVEEVLLEIECDEGNFEIVEDEERFLEQAEGHQYSIQGKVVDMKEHTILVRANIDMAISISDYPSLLDGGKEIEVGDMIWAQGEMNIFFDPSKFEEEYWE